MKRWATQICSEFVEISADGLTARYLVPGGEDMHGGVIGNGPIPLFREGFYFEIVIDEQITDMPDGLSIGVTLTAPDQIDEMPITIDNIQHAFVVGYDGQAYDSE